MRRFAIYDIFKRNGVVFRDREAVVDGDERLTFGNPSSQKKRWICGQGRG